MNPDHEAMLQHIRDQMQGDPEMHRRTGLMREALDRANSIQDITNAYRLGVIPLNASARQIQETEQAQFAACQMLLKVLLDKFNQGGDAPQLWIDAVMAEIDQYAKRRISTMMSRPDGQSAH